MAMTIGRDIDQLYSALSSSPTVDMLFYAYRSNDAFLIGEARRALRSWADLTRYNSYYLKDSKPRQHATTTQTHPTILCEHRRRRLRAKPSRSPG